MAKGEKLKELWKDPAFRARMTEVKKRAATHGMSRMGAKHPIYLIWETMRQRCNNPNNKGYKNYGARGIRVEWTSFEEFRDAMLEPYLAHVKEFGRLQTSIERIDNNGNYSTENCRWATRKEQIHNQRQRTIRRTCKRCGVKHRKPVKCADAELDNTLSLQPRHQWIT